MSKTSVPGGMQVKLKEKESMPKLRDVKNVLLAVIRVRGDVNKSHKIKDTFSLLRLHKKNHLVLVPATESIKGMLFKVKDFIAFGMIDKPTLVALLKSKGKLIGKKPIDEDFIKNVLGYEGFEDLADKLLSLDLKYQDLEKIVPVFRMHPPRGGFLKGIKVQFTQGGALGFHGKKINDLINRMV